MRIKKFDEYFRISEDMNYHIDQNMSILDNVFRPGSGKFFALLREARSLYEAGRFSPSEDDRYIFAETSIGEFFESDGKLIPLDLPMLNEEAEYHGKEVDLNKPMRSSGPKKYKVYVKNPKTGKVKVVHFGDVKGGLTSKINDAEARKSFVARHKCKLKKDRTKPGYWSCNLPRYAKYLGISGGGNFYW